jgi:hypothetical protein
MATWEYGADLPKVDPAHRVLNIGTYNPYITACGICASDKIIENFGRDCLGFGMPDKPAHYLDKNIAVVYECPDCLERQWNHTTLIGGYYAYLRHLHEQKANDPARI